MKHIYLAPHLDDAVLSCGAAIHRYAMSGETVRVVTVFAGEPGPNSILSKFAREHHAQWGGPSDPMSLRRAENVLALTRLGSESLHLDYHDAVYRTDTDGTCIYQDPDAIFGEVRPSDPLAGNGASELAERLAQIVCLGDQQTVYAPLGVGHHVDHQIVHAAARRLLAQGHRVAFYEDYPYAEHDGAVESAVAETGAEDWLEEPVAVSAADVSAKVSALNYYRTQMSTLFGGMEAVPNRVWTFATTRAQAVCLAERIWWPQ